MALSTFQTVRSILEVLYFLSSVVLACVGLVALYQIILAKRVLSTANESLKVAVSAVETARLDIELRSKREAVTLAADKCAEFGPTILEVYQKLNGMPATRRWTLENTSFDESSIKEWEAATLWERNLRKAQKIDDATIILNQLEAFAMYFAKGAADAQVAYPAVGAVFCDWVERLAPHLIMMRSKDLQKQIHATSGPFQNVVELYSAWSSRSTKEALELDASRISSRLSGMQVSDILPIGTK